MTPHFHSLVPDGVFVPGEGGVRFEALLPPTQGEVERLLRVVRHRVLRLLERRGALPAQGPEDALQAYQAHSLQQRLRWTEVDVRPPPRKQSRCALLEGFSLHANTHLHANDRQGLERLCRYGARGALALERLSRAQAGRIAWRMKRPLPDGTTHLFFTGLELLRRLASLVPPPRALLLGPRLRPPLRELEKTLTSLQSEYEGVSPEWKFSKTSGWYVTYNKKKKRLFYLFPTEGDFTFKIVFNDRCLGQIGKGSFPKYVMDMLKSAKKYPEGTLCVFDKGNFKVDTILDLLRIKIDN